MTDENIDLRFLAEQSKRILNELAEMRSELRGSVSELRSELKGFREDVASADLENAKILETITNMADLKTIFVDLQARVVRSEKRITALGKRPEQ